MAHEPRARYRHHGLDRRPVLGRVELRPRHDAVCTCAPEKWDQCRGRANDVCGVRSRICPKAARYFESRRLRMDEIKPFEARIHAHAAAAAVILPGSARLALHPSAHVANKRCQHPQANESPRLICATRSLPRRMRKAVDQHRTRLASPARPSCCGVLPPEVCMTERTVFLISGSRIPRGLVRGILSEIAFEASELSFVAPRFGRALRSAFL